MTDNRKYNIYQDIIELSDIELQKKRWLSDDSDEISSYEELMCSFFDDNNIIDFIDSELAKYSPSSELKKSLQKLVTALNDFDDNGFDNEQIFNSRPWNKIISIAGEVRVLWENELPVN